MNTSKRIPKSDLSPQLPRWLVAAGIAVGLMAPLSASADHNGNGVVEVLASAAVAYVVIDAVGGFDDNDRHHRKNRYRHGRHDRHADRDYRYGRDDRRYWAHRDQRSHRKHGYRNTHRRHNARHHRAHRYGSGHYDHRRNDRRYRRTAYH